MFYYMVDDKGDWHLIDGVLNYDESCLTYKNFICKENLTMQSCSGTCTFEFTSLGYLRIGEVPEEML